MKNKYLKYITTLSIAAVMFSLTGCLKDSTSPGSENYSHSPALVSFQYSGFAAVPFVAGLLGTAQDSFSLELTLSVASQTLSSPVSVTVATDPASLAAFNADSTRSSYPTVFTALPTTQYSLSNGGSVVINPGQNMVKMSIKFAGDKIDFSNDYAIPLKITDASGATIATNLNTAIVIVKLTSIYEADYLNAGTIYRYLGATEASGLDPSAPSFAITGTSHFSTVTANEIDGQLVIPGFSTVEITLTVNADNSVTVGPTPITSTAHNNPNKPSTYDPATQTFDIHGAYTNSAGALREFDCTLTRQ